MKIVQFVDIVNAVVLSVGEKYDGQVISEMFLEPETPTINILTENNFHEYGATNGMMIKMLDGRFAQIKLPTQ